MGRALLLVALLAHLVVEALAWSSKRAMPPSAAPAQGFELYRPGAIAIIPQDNRTVFYSAFDSAKEEIRIEICVLEDPDILSECAYRGGWYLPTGRPIPLATHLIPPQITQTHTQSA
jgi:hypothetical protein